NVADVFNWTTREERDGGHGPSRADANTWHEPVVVATQILDRRHLSEIDLVVVEEPRADCGKIVPNPPSIRRPVESPRQRTGIQITHGAEAHGCLARASEGRRGHQPIRRNRPSRPAGAHPGA